MAIPIKDLLNDAVRRARNSRPIQSAQLISETNRCLAQFMPAQRQGDARAIACRDQVVTVACLNGAAASFVAQREGEILTCLKKRLPENRLKRVQTKIVGEFPEREFMIE